jgi:uncharacterized membrane protein
MKSTKAGIHIKSLWLLPVIVCLLIMLLPGAALAQTGKEGLILYYASGGYDSEIKPGESVTIFIEVSNEKITATNNIQFSADAPDEWVVQFNPQSIDILDGESIQNVEVTVTAPKNVEKGDYSITIIADSSIGRRVIGTYFWVEKGTNVWIWVGGALGVAVIIAFAFIYRRFTKD